MERDAAKRIFVRWPGFVIRRNKVLLSGFVGVHRQSDGLNVREHGQGIHVLPWMSLPV